GARDAVARVGRATARGSAPAWCRVSAWAGGGCAPLSPALTMRVLALPGSEDPGSTPAMSAAIAAACPRGLVAIIPGARHLLPLDAPQAVADAITRHAGRAGWRPSRSSRARTQSAGGGG